MVVHLTVYCSSPRFESYPSAAHGKLSQLLGGLPPGMAQHMRIRCCGWLTGQKQTCVYMPSGLLQSSEFQYWRPQLRPGRETAAASPTELPGESDSNGQWILHVQDSREKKFILAGFCSFMTICSSCAKYNIKTILYESTSPSTDFRGFLGKKGPTENVAISDFYSHHPLLVSSARRQH